MCVFIATLSTKHFITKPILKRCIKSQLGCIQASILLILIHQFKIYHAAKYMTWSCLTSLILEWYTIFMWSKQHLMCVCVCVCGVLQHSAVMRTTETLWTGTPTAPVRRPSACGPPSNTTSWGPWSPTLPSTTTQTPRTWSSWPRRLASPSVYYRLDTHLHHIVPDIQQNEKNYTQNKKSKCSSVLWW